MGVRRRAGLGLGMGRPSGKAILLSPTRPLSLRCARAGFDPVGKRPAAFTRLVFLMGKGRPVDGGHRLAHGYPLPAQHACSRAAKLDRGPLAPCRTLPPCYRIQAGAGMVALCRCSLSNISCPGGWGFGPRWCAGGLFCRPDAVAPCAVRLGDANGCAPGMQGYGSRGSPIGFARH